MCYGESSTSDKKGMNSAFCRACFLEATALDPPRFQLAFSALRPSQSGTDLLWLRVSPTWLSGLLGHPRGVGDSAQRIGSMFLPFWETVGPQAHSLVHSFVQACPGAYGGPSPRNTKGESHSPKLKGLRVAQETDRETVWGEAQVGCTCVMVITGGPGPACER